MTWHPEILSRRQQQVLKQIGQALTGRGFYLAGGTAAALYLGHRRSVDFDWFTHHPFEPLAIAQELRDGAIPFTTTDVAPGTLHGSVRTDLAAMKVAAIAQRGAKKDFVDIYALCKMSCTLRKALRWYQKKYAVAELGHALIALAYFEDADPEPMPRMLWHVTWRGVKATFGGWLRELSS
jgi:hypothetical protein